MRKSRIYNVSSCCERKEDIVQYYMLKDTQIGTGAWRYIPRVKRREESPKISLQPVRSHVLGLGIFAAVRVPPAGWGGIPRCWEESPVYWIWVNRSAQAGGGTNTTCTGSSCIQSTSILSRVNRVRILVHVHVHILTDPSANCQ